MGGAIGEGNRTPAAEFNIWADPEAAQRVFQEGLDTTMVGLDVTHQALIKDAHTEAMRSAGRVGKVVAELMDFYARFHKERYPDLDGSPMHDPVCVAHLIDPTLVEVRDAHIEVDCTTGRAGDARTSTGGAASTTPAEREGRVRYRRRALRRAGRRAHQQPVIVFAAIAPHGGLVFDQPEAPTRQGMEELGRRFAAAAAEAVIVLTPHGVGLDGHFAVVRSARLEGDASQWTDEDTHYEGPGEPQLADECIRALQRANLPALGLTFGSTAAGSSTMPLDWGALIPLSFMRAPAVVVSPCRALSNEQHVRAGRSLADATGGRRIALIASADHGHGHSPDGPYGFAAESATYDREIQALVRENRLGALQEWEPGIAVAAKADSFWQLLMLHGAIGNTFDAELLSYEAPTYYGMLTASFTPSG